MVRARTNSNTLQFPWEKIGNWVSPVKITAILVDACSDTNLEGYHNFGVVKALESSLDKPKEPVPTIEPLEREPLREDPCYPLFHLTTGSLHNVVGLQLRKNQHRFLGLRICHSSGLDDYLGSWDPQDTAHTMTLFDHTEGQLARVQFDLAEGKYGLYVSGISASVDPPSAADREWQLSLSPVLPKVTLLFHCDVPNKVG